MASGKVEVCTVLTLNSLANLANLALLLQILHFVQVHHLKQEYKAEDEDACAKELDRFLHYVSII